MRWVTNIFKSERGPYGGSVLRHYIRNGHVKGPPMETHKYSQEELREMGMVGIYLSDPSINNPRYYDE